MRIRTRAITATAGVLGLLGMALGVGQEATAAAPTTLSPASQAAVNAYALDPTKTPPATVVDNKKRTGTFVGTKAVVVPASVNGADPEAVHIPDDINIVAKYSIGNLRYKFGDFVLLVPVRARFTYSTPGMGNLAAQTSTIGVPWVFTSAAEDANLKAPLKQSVTWPIRNAAFTTAGYQPLFSYGGHLDGDLGEASYYCHISNSKNSFCLEQQSE